MLVFESNVISPINSEVTAETNDIPVRILLIMDNPVGAEYVYLREILEDRFSWDVKTFALQKAINPCTTRLPGFEVDYTLDDLPNIDTFDAISIMPGPIQDNLLNSPQVLDLVKEADNKNLVVSAWCRGVRILAAADVIDGKNVTGHWDFKLDYIAAGANYFESVPPIIDGNIVTCVSSTQYRNQMCCAIAEAIGVFEDNRPEIQNAEVSMISSSTFLVEVNATDDSGIYAITVELYQKISEDRFTSFPNHIFELTKIESSNLYSAEISITKGEYRVEIKAEDLYFNIKALDVPNILVTKTAVNYPIIIFSIALFSIVIISLVIKLKNH